MLQMVSKHMLALSHSLAKSLHLVVYSGISRFAVEAGFAATTNRYRLRSMHKDLLVTSIVQLDFSARAL